MANKYRLSGTISEHYGPKRLSGFIVEVGGVSIDTARRIATGKARPSEPLRRLLELHHYRQVLPWEWIEAGAFFSFCGNQLMLGGERYSLGDIRRSTWDRQANARMRADMKLMEERMRQAHPLSAYEVAVICDRVADSMREELVKNFNNKVIEK